MQNTVLKFPVIILSLFILSAFQVSGQNSAFRLHVADSLFTSKQYTQSLEHYQKILDNNEYTPSMLLKMAYIQEGLGQIGQGLYYLNLYYFTTDDASANQKMDDLASKYNLEGYKQDDTSWLLMNYAQYHFFVTLGLGMLCLVALVIAFQNQWKTKKRPIGAVIFLWVVCIVLALHLNLGNHLSYGVVASPNTYVMSGPSSGADVVGIIEGGHRLQILGRKDVWLHVKWNGESAYIKENGLLRLEL